MGAPSPLYVGTADILKCLPLSHSGLDNLIKRGAFPPPIGQQFSKRRFWFRTEIESWLRNNGLAALPPHETGSESA